MKGFSQIRMFVTACFLLTSGSWMQAQTSGNSADASVAPAEPAEGICDDC
jgi:hypothetical protein